MLRVIEDRAEPHMRGSIPKRERTTIEGSDEFAVAGHSNGFPTSLAVDVRARYCPFREELDAHVNANVFEHGI